MKTVSEMDVARRLWLMLVALCVLVGSARQGRSAGDIETNAAPAAVSTDASQSTVSSNTVPVVAALPVIEAATNAIVPVPPRELWFPVGEEMTYKIYWGLIPVGKTIVTTGWEVKDGRTVLVIRHRTRSNKVIATMYPVNDLLETIIEPMSFRPISFMKDLHEGKTRYHEITTFDYDALKGHWRSLLSTKAKDFDIEPDTRDIVTFMYYMRSKTFRPGEQSHYRVMADEKVYDLYLDVKKPETVDLDGFGRVQSLRLEPQAKFEGLFVRKGKMTIWVSRDARAVCTQVKASVPVGSVRVVVAEVKGPGDDLWIKRSPKDDSDKGDE